MRFHYFLESYCVAGLLRLQFLSVFYALPVFRLPFTALVYTWEDLRGSKMWKYVCQT